AFIGSEAYFVFVALRVLPSRRPAPSGFVALVDAPSWPRDAFWRRLIVELGLVRSDIWDGCRNLIHSRSRAWFIRTRHDWPDAARPASSVRARNDGCRALRQGRMAEPRRFGQGSRRRAHDPRRRSDGDAPAPPRPPAP